MKLLYVIILSFNGGKDLIDCVGSVINSKTPSDWERMILLVDNGSKDGSLVDIKRLVEGNNGRDMVNIIENGRNLGFAAGMNVGIREALKDGAEAVLLLNQDTSVQDDFLIPLLANPADIVSPIIKFKRKGEWVYDFGGKINWWIGRPCHLETKNIRKMIIRDIDYVSGCAMLIKRSVLERVGLLDERYFLYFEDVDFCIRARKAGSKIAVEPRSIVTHKLSEKAKKPFKQHLCLLKSNFIFINQHISIWRRPIAYAYLKLLFIKMLLNQISKC